MSVAPIPAVNGSTPPMPQPDPLQLEAARSLEADPVLLEHLPELLRDLDELGGSASQAEAMLAPHASLAAPPGSLLLDLACGKGALTVALAERFGWRAVGVDALSPFIDDARRRAEAAGLADRCAFHVGDLREPAAGEPAEGADVGLVLGIGGAFEGGLAALVGVLRRRVKPGGLMLFDDCVMQAGAPERVRRAFTGCHPPEVARADALRHGDTLLIEHHTPPAEAHAINVRNTGLIRRRAEAIGRAHPELGEALRAYIDGQQAETDATAPGSGAVESTGPGEEGAGGVADVGGVGGAALGYVTWLLRRGEG